MSGESIQFVNKGYERKGGGGEGGTESLRVLTAGAEKTCGTNPVSKVGTKEGSIVDRTEH